MTTQISSPACPRCGGGMKQRNSARGGFWGCCNYPRCTGIVNQGTAAVPPSQPAPALDAAPSDPIVGTPQQEAFWRAVTEGNTHLVLSARAGSGKSFSIKHAARLALQKWPRLKIGFCAFNRDIAQDLKKDIPSQCEAATMHSLGFRAIIGHLGRKPDVQSDKTTLLLKDMILPDELDERGRVNKDLGRAVTALVSLSKGYLFDGTPAQLDELATNHDVELAPNRAARSRVKDPRMGAGENESDTKFKARVYELVPRVLERAKAVLSTVDQDDMIWLPVVMELPLARFDLLLVDESQDLNACQQALAFLLCPAPGRIIVVGDPKQAIYRFRGADAKSMETMMAGLAETARGVEELPLTWTRRCPKAVVKLAQELVPDIEAMPEAPEGIVEHVFADDAPAKMSPGDMVLCRTNAPLVKVAHQLLRAEKKALLRGRDLSKPILELMDALGERDVQVMGQKLAEFRAIETARLDSANKAATVIAAFEDKCDTLEVLMEGCRTRADVEAKIRRIFEEKDPDGAIILTSVHSSKGLEAQTIWLLKPELMPHPAAVKKGRAEELDQENNLRYVALTRSQNRLVFITDSRPIAPDDEDDHSDPFADESDEGTGYFDEDDEPGDDHLVKAFKAEFEVPCAEDLDWREDARKQLRSLYGAAPFDAPDAYFEALSRAQEALPRGS